MVRTFRDRYGVSVTGADEGAVALLDEAVETLVALTGDPVAAADTAAAADPHLHLARCVQAYLLCFTASERGCAAARSLLSDSPLPVTDRERAHHNAAESWAAGDLESATLHLERALLHDPRDLLALKIAQDLYFFLGDQVNLRQVVARVLPAWKRESPGTGFVEAMYAFGLEECGSYRAAERHGRAALAAFPNDVWGAHAVIHVLEMEGRQGEGTAFVAATEADWNHSFFAVHNWWHSGLYRLEMRQEPDALAVYDGPIRSAGLATPLDRVDASSLLWRCSLQGVDPGFRAAELSESFGADLDDSTYCFNDWHACMALGLAEQFDVARELLAVVAGRAIGTNRFVLKQAGLDLLGGFLAFSCGDFPRAVELLGRSRPAARVVGGSHAQRDVIDLTLLAAAAAARQDGLVQTLFAERVARKPTAEAAARRVIEVGIAKGRV
jgi:hypothetical protein